MATQRPSIVRAVGAVDTSGGWTADRQRALLNDMRGGRMPDGTPAQDGVYPLHGQTVTVRRRPDAERRTLALPPLPTPASGQAPGGSGSVTEGVEDIDQDDDGDLLGTNALVRKTSSHHFQSLQSTETGNPAARAQNPPLPPPVRHMTSRTDGAGYSGAANVAAGSGVSPVIAPSTTGALGFAEAMASRGLRGDGLAPVDDAGRRRKRTREEVGSLPETVSQAFNSDGAILQASDTIRKLIEDLSEINGQDGYSNKAQALGKLAVADYLVVPSDLEEFYVPVDEVGSRAAIRRANPLYVFSVYALNKEACTLTDNIAKVKFALLRMEAIKWGCEHVFRTTGHHFLSGLTGGYVGKYEQLIRSCLVPEILNFCDPEILYHKAFHWIGPARVWSVLITILNTDRIPEAIRLRVNAAPAGSALITTTSSVLTAMRSLYLFDELASMRLCDLDSVIAMNDTIKADPPKYHKVTSAYNREPLNEADKAALAVAKQQAEIVSPICKAFVTVFLNRAPLGKQKVLDKPAANNPVLYNRAKRYFQVFNRQAPASFKR
ncbi:hypothetical protein LIER_25948 [Lithospermum erythrorhizon]|uniref:Uncharacterized protein n=1 Tax=Lithospermum erythrorhizon TaxID=34254 RepID=A0AAV3R6N1_LITER